jgi:hypothetical protein
MKRIGGSVLRWGLRVAVSLWIVVIYFHDPGVSGYERAEFGEMVHGQAWRPFVTRALFPAVVRFAAQAVPARIESAIAGSALATRIVAWLKWEPSLYREYLTAFVLTVACVALLSLVLQRLWAAMFRSPAGYGEAFSILGLLGIPALYKFYSYIYDLPFLLLYTACLLMIAQRRWVAYFMLFGLACLSKETSVLLILVFAAYFYRSAHADRRTYWRFIAFQLLVLVIARAGLGWVFRENPGSMLEFHLLDYNVGLLSRPWSLNAVVTWGVLAALVLADYGQKPWLLRVAAAMLIPLLALCLFFGLLDELRDYYEVYVPIALLVGVTVCRLLGRQIEIIAPTTADSVGPIRAAGGR